MIVRGKQIPKDLCVGYYWNTSIFSMVFFFKLYYVLYVYKLLQVVKD